MGDLAEIVLKRGEAPKAFSVKTVFDSSGLVIVDGLGPDDHQTGRRLYEDLMHLRDPHGGLFAAYEKVTDRAEFVALLTRMRQQCSAGIRPIVHIEAHGDRERGLGIGELREWVSWDELGATLAEMNALTRNNLGVVVGACHGFYLLNNLSIEKPSPYYFLIAPTDEVSAGLIEDKMPPFYRTLLNTRSFEPAAASLGKQFQCFLADKFYTVTFARQLRDHSIGAGAKRNVEQLVSRAVREGKATNREEIRTLRLRLRPWVKSPEWTYYQMARVFLHRRPAVNFLQLKTFVQSVYST